MYETERAALVAELETSGRLKSPDLRAAFAKVPRHAFLPKQWREHAYADGSVDLGAWSCASSPSVMAAMLEQLEIQPGDRVLEIGTGSGYNAAILSELVGADGRVATIEFDRGLASSASAALAALDYGNVAVIQGDGFLGCEAQSPYDRLIATCASFDVSPHWEKQLLMGGRLVLPLALSGVVQ